MQNRDRQSLEDMLATPLLACDTAKVLEALTGHQPLNRQPPETSVKSED